MAQAATMGPPLSPRETRRSGRRSAPSASTSTSKSPDSDQPPRQKDFPQRSSSASNSRNKRLKQEDFDDPVDDPRPTPGPPLSSATSNGTTNGKQKRKAKDKDKDKEKEKPLSGQDALEEPPQEPGDEQPLEPPEEEEQGITRCVCGSSGEDDPDAGEFMVQCETCKVWQHGLCMGYQTEDQVHDDDYYCEQCRPELHTELLKKLAKRPRHSSATSHLTSATVASRVSRSHSPSHLLKQPSKRRNTMNSRDAAFDESLKEIIEATAAEAAAVQDAVISTSSSTANGHADPDDDADAGPNGRKKRKRTEEETTSAAKKRTRSASTVSDRPGSLAVRADTPVNITQSKTPSQAPAPALKPAGRNKRGGRKNVAAAADAVASVEGEGAASTPAPPSKRLGGGRTKGAGAVKRPPLSHVVSHGPGSASHEHGTRRHQSGSGVNGQHASSSAAVESSRAYRNSHAYAVSQQPLFTSWGLPDYLSHLEPMLPTDTPQPLEVRSSQPGGRGDSVERTTERGVKVKWPSKRMSVGDMNKRVRALVEWVGREQANALDRDRRREALEKALNEEAESSEDRPNWPGGAVDGDNDVTMILDVGVTKSPENEKTQEQAAQHVEARSVPSLQAQSEESKSTMKIMEELMEELIGFQERFGPGAKSRERERRTAAAAAAAAAGS